MTDYTKTTDFAAKDALQTGHANKVTKGEEVDTEFNNIATHSATKANKVGSATNNNVVSMDSNGDIQDAGFLSTDVARLSQTQTLTGDKTLSGATTLSGTAALSGVVTFSGTIAGASPMVFEGATADAFETTFAITDPTADRTITFKDESGTVAYTADVTAAIFTEEYDSGNQTITAAGSLALAHSLSSAPKLYSVHIVCTDAGGDLGYSQNDEVLIIEPGVNGSANNGVAVVPDATNMNIRFGSGANTFRALNYSTGAAGNLTNSKWKLVVRAWA